MSVFDKQIEPLSVSTSEAARLLGVSRPTIYELIQNGGLPWFKIGTRTLIPVAGLREWVAAQAEKRDNT